MAARDPNNQAPSPVADRSLIRTGVFLLAWIGFISYAFLLAPGSGEAARAVDMSLLKELIANPVSTSVTPFFVAIFNALGVMPAVYALLLLPGSRGQKLPAGLFCLGSFFLGFFALGPYLAFRSYRPVPALPQSSWLRPVLESRIPAMLALVGAVFVVYLGLLGGAPSDLATRASEYTALFQSQMFVHVSSLDLLVLSLFVVDPLREDMARRGVQGSLAGKALAVAALPVIGPCLYLVLRPPLPLNDEKAE